MIPAISDEPCDETVHNLLTVPMKFIILKSNATTKRQRKLLHGEASCFIKIRLLATEIDVLLGIASQSLERRMKCRQYSYNIASIVCSNFHEKIVKQKKRKLSSSSPTALQHVNPLHLRSLIPILYTHGEYSCESQLSYVESEMRRCLKELYDCAEALHQFSEQNLSVAEQLSEMFTIQEETEKDHEREHDHGPLESTCKGHALANEKMIVGKIEENLCSRINALVKMSFSDDCNHHESTTIPTTSLLDAFEMAKDPKSGQFLSMKHLCEQLENSLNDSKNRGNDKTVKQMSETNEMELIPKNVKMESEMFDDITRKYAESTFQEPKEHGEAFANTEVKEEVPMIDGITESIDVAATTLSALRKTA